MIDMYRKLNRENQKLFFKLVETLQERTEAHQEETDSSQTENYTSREDAVLHL